jgi:hypothetical protein
MTNEELTEDRQKSYEEFVHKAAIATVVLAVILFCLVAFVIA